MKSQKFLFSLLVCIFLANPCWAGDPLLQDEYLEQQSSAKKINDPWEKFNRKMFSFNDKLIKRVLEPISKGYDVVVPKRVQKSIYNLFSNVRMPIRFFSCLAQGKFSGATTEMGRFVMNSSLGVGGFFDPALKFAKLEKQDEDFGQTLGFHGVKPVRYVVLPFIGPTNVRDGLGRILDAAFDPLTWVGIYEWVDPQEAMYGIGAFEKVNSFSYKGHDQYNDFLKGAIDPYVAVKDAYLQNRDKKIKE